MANELTYQSEFTGEQIDERLAAVPEKYVKPEDGIPASDLASDIQNPIVGISSPLSPDGTIIATKANGDTITIDLNHNHTQYLKYVMLNSESDMPADPDNTTLYMWPATS